MVACWRSRTWRGPSSSRSFAARSKSISPAASRIAASRADQTVHPPSRKAMTSAMIASYSSLVTAPMHGATERPMW